MINSGSAALDGTGLSVNENGERLMKKWWDMTDTDIQACLDNTKWCPATANFFKGGGFSSQFRTSAKMPVTLIRLNYIHGVGPALQLAEGYTIQIPDEVSTILENRTDPTWPTTWFVPILNGEDVFTDVYSVMANWGANHGSFSYGHVGDRLITLASMLRIPVSMHNVERSRIFRPHSWSGFGTKNLEVADYKACEAYGPLYL